ncbi:MAG: addiction module protein [Planctomycetaceae bacterium]|nr:addiction module protein [Planctomycetaceae bacterium]
MTVHERVALAQAIWDSIPPEVTPLSDSQKQEVDRRLAAHRSDPTAAIPWEQVEAEALARLPK